MTGENSATALSSAKRPQILWRDVSRMREFMAQLTVGIRPPGGGNRIEADSNRSITRRVHLDGVAAPIEFDEVLGQHVRIHV